VLAWCWVRAQLVLRVVLLLVEQEDQKELQQLLDLGEQRDQELQGQA